MNANVIQFVGQNEDHQRLRNAKWAYTTRLLAAHGEDFHIHANLVPKAGDLVLATVDQIGKQTRLELPSGRRARMFPGDEIVVVFGNRYAPDQYEALVPTRLRPCHLVASGGIAGQMTVKHGAIKAPTRITPVGILVNAQGKAVNLTRYGLPAGAHHRRLPPVLAVVGGAMNAGKTTAAASLVRGLTLAGMTVNAGKVTGTGSGCDIWHLNDAGAGKVLDFLDLGYPSTYLLPPSNVQQILEDLLAHLNTEDTDFIVLEVADGLFQAETRALVDSDHFKNLVSGVVFAAADAMGAVHGVDLLQKWAVPVVAVSGALTRSPLGMREVQDAVDVPVLDRKVLRHPIIAQHAAAWFDVAPVHRSAQGGY